MYQETCHPAADRFPRLQLGGATSQTEGVGTGTEIVEVEFNKPRAGGAENPTGTARTPTGGTRIAWSKVSWRLLVINLSSLASQNTTHFI